MPLFAKHLFERQSPQILGTVFLIYSDPHVFSFIT